MTLTLPARFGGKVALWRDPPPLYVVEHNVDGDGKKSPGFRPYVTIHWAGTSVDVVGDFAEVVGFFNGEGA